MSPIAVLYDVHGNLPALEAVLGDARSAGASSFVLGGDYALFGPFPAETVATLRELPGAVWIRGNVDRWSARPDEAPDDELIQAAIAACRDVLGAAADDLGELPADQVIGATRFCHASPLSDVRSFSPSASEADSELIAGVHEPRLAFGHTHLQFERHGPGGVELVNPGSVGMPFDGDHRAAYALMLDDGSLELRRVPYDHQVSAAAMIERFGDVAWARRSAERLRRAEMV